MKLQHFCTKSLICEKKRKEKQHNLTNLHRITIHGMLFAYLNSDFHAAFAC